MKPVKMYESEDGNVFKTPREAVLHDLGIALNRIWDSKHDGSARFERLVGFLFEERELIKSHFGNAEKEDGE